MKKIVLPPSAKDLDDADRRILAELCADGRLTNVELARRVGLSTTPCWNRVRRLEALGVITGYGANVSMEALGLRETVFVEVSLRDHGGEAINAFAQAVQDLPEVLEAWVVSGRSDFSLKVAAASTAEYERFLRDRLYRIPNVRRVKSRFTLRRLKPSRA